MLTLFEELLLLSIHEAKSTFIRSVTDRVKPGLGGAILAELALMGKIQLSNNHRLQLVDDSETKVDVLDEALGALKDAEKERKFGYWINALSEREEKYRRQIVKSLIQKGVVTQDDDHLFWVIPSPLQPEIQASAKYLVNKRLRGIVLAQGDIQPRDIVLLSLLRASGLLDLVFLRDERKLANRNIYELAINQALKDPVFQTIQEIESALAAIVEED